MSNKQATTKNEKPNDFSGKNAQGSAQQKSHKDTSSRDTDGEDKTQSNSKPKDAGKEVSKNHTPKK